MSGIFSKLFKQGPGIKNVITLFHSPNSPASLRVYTLLKQANAASVAHATEDQASSHEAHNKAEKTEFDLDVTEADPTPDQLRSILEFVGSGSASKVVQGATDEGDAVQKLKGGGSAFQRPVTVDWDQGKVVLGDNESEIMKLIREIPKETGKV
ncbi:hypothetical protein NA57DRAFT_76923 [Rhizodiscina lignyota]|uniref:DUF1687-domain-containing protein n=1 Tax=Rhizodiscina lignyota TaxID=1504668 RepID=A0A9P4M5I9_9PEZI|nr:hypothetical protein NA57DRAFT_76923 [Rhizodiscina lignyota]